MNSKSLKTLAIVALTVVLLGFVGVQKAEAVESFSIAWSEYPSWSVFGVAGEPKGGEYLINGKKGVLGVIEQKWGVDIVLKELDYDSCLVLYGAGQCDAVCITNMDVLNPSLGLKSVVVLPTSTSFGADACIVTRDITDVKQLRASNNMKIFGLAKSVSEYCWARNLELRGEDEMNYRFTNMDPGAAAIAVQTGQKTHKAVVVWNPFVMQTLKTKKDTHVLFDSTTIPGEIIDMVVMSQESLAKPGGKAAACAIIEAYYTICKYLANPQTQDYTLVALGRKFSNLNAGEMKTVVRQTRFYATPDQGISLFTGGVVFPWARKVANTTDLFTNKGFNPESKIVTDKSLKDIMPIVVDFCVNHDMVPKSPVIGYGSQAEVGSDVQLVFDPSYMKAVAERQ